MWIWTALHADSKLILSCECDHRPGATALEFMDDLRSPATDGHKAQSVSCPTCELHGARRSAPMSPGRQNLTMRRGMRRFTRLTSVFPRKIENHPHALSLYVIHEDFVRLHGSLRDSPAMAADVSDTLRDMESINGLINGRAPVPQCTGPRPGTR
ncbi:MAG: hypothetical protein OXC93_11045 [Rhodospirillaceae bacterium]|nr:hypothetical protein [Rhodospirillaceae bacterium]